MTTRRDFIGGMTGVAFVGCELMHATHAHAQPAPRRREVPDRFVAFASVALQYPDLAAEQSTTP
ncbi:MAG TPA: hypothetical protein VNC81_16410 [Xanthobacteraceae bacterium]|nr:hypothetical protein [Xanthobacteraceae bacterium]